jgi:hypothetical protein
MRNRELIRQLQFLKALIKRTDAASSLDFELQGHWGKYLCVLAAGFLENALREIYMDFVARAASPPVAKFASSTLEKILNPKSSRFVEVCRSFKPSWGQALEAFMDEDVQRRAAIDSIMRNRHLIAHGRNATISVAQVAEYLDAAVKVVEFIEDQCFK